MSAFEPTDAHRKLVVAAARIGLPADTICQMIENPGTGKALSPKTLRLHFRAELDLAVERANATVAARLYSLALNGNVAACIFWMKTRAGWREKVDHELSGDITIEVVRFGQERKAA
jgi:hypothetical protein